MRDFNGKLIAPFLKLTGFRFSKDYRWNAENNNFYGWVYYMVDTVGANIAANGKINRL